MSGSNQEPSVGSIVHYVSYGTPGGEYPSVCWAAVVTGVTDWLGDAYAPGYADLCVIGPEGFFFNRTVKQDEESKCGGTWHWPEFVP